MKNLFAIICTLGLMLSIALPGHAGGPRPSFSARSSYSGGFRSSNSSSYRSYSPSRTFSFRSSPSTSTASRTAPRSYSYSVPKATIAAPVSRSTTKRTVINNHYHGESGHSSWGGLSMMDYLALHSLTSHDHSPTYVTAQPVSVGSPTMMVNNQDMPAVIYQQEESHFWRNFLLIIVVLVVVVAIVAAGVHYHELEEEED